MTETGFRYRECEHPHDADADVDDGEHEQEVAVLADALSVPHEADEQAVHGDATG